MTNLMDLFKHMQEQYKGMLSGGADGTWTSINKGMPAALVRVSSTERTGFIVYKKYVFNFMFSSGGNEFTHVMVRKSNKAIGISGPCSLEIFCSPSSLRGLTFVSAVGACLSDTLYWETFFKTHGANA